jgi:PAS domain S-box-containing protein
MNTLPPAFPSPTFRFQSCNPAYATMHGYTEEELRELGYDDVVHPDDRERHSELVRRLIAEEIPSFEITNRCLGKGNRHLWVHKHLSLLRDAAGKPTNIIALVTDITERKRADERIGVLMREVNHRAKNLLTLVQAIARQTTSKNPEDFMRRFEQRIRALAAGHDLLVKNDWRGVEIRELVAAELGYFRDAIGTRIAIFGPSMFLSASAAQALGMALHELATNAGKYGALSKASGSIDLTWDIIRDREGDEVFLMDWRESGGPHVTAPSRSGFGTTVIGSALETTLDGTVEIDYPS